jgi:hypothetical protein
MIQPKKQMYTIKGQGDGFGSQYQSVMSGIAFSELNNYVYVHTPFATMEHNVDVDKLNTFIGINNNHLPADDLLSPDIIIQSYADNVHWSDNPSIYYTDNVKQKIRGFYNSTPKPVIEDIDIAIHIRRGDVNTCVANGCSDFAKRFTDNAKYITLIQALKIHFPTKKIHIFSEGNLEDFKEFGLSEENFKLNLDVIETFHSLVCAKILVIANSSFSYSSAILNDNIVYYMDDFLRFWHKPLNNWLNAESFIKCK